MTEVGSRDYRAAIQAKFARLGTKKKRIAEYVLDHPLEVISSSVQRLAVACGCEQTTIVRFAQELGFSGITALKIAIARQSNMVWGEFSAENSDEAHPLDGVIEQLRQIHSETLMHTLRGLDRKTLESLLAALTPSTKIMTFGAGTSQLAACDMAIKFVRLGIQCFHYEDVEFSKTFLNYLAPDGILFLISHSGETPAVLMLAELARYEKIRFAAITSNVNSALGKAADWCFITDSRHERPIRFGVMTSRIAQFAVVDAITLLYSMRDQERSWEFISKGYHENV
jgi:RpiR family carbohydrate utilization transcriptional regulator